MKIPCMALYALLMAGAASATEDSVCTFQAPVPVLDSKAYPHRAFKRESYNSSTESVTVRNGVRVEIEKSQCVDFVATTISVVVQREKHDDAYWLDFARAEIAKLKFADSATQFSDIGKFLAQAKTGKHSACKDGSSAEAGACSWASGGGFSAEVQSDAASTRVTATEYTSG